MISDENQILILLDALDECIGRSEFPSFLTDHKHSSLQTRIMVTSRDEKDIRNAFGALPRMSLESQSQLISKDIELYVRTRLDTNPELA
jgi:hypothetical protein